MINSTVSDNIATGLDSNSSPSNGRGGGIDARGGSLGGSLSLTDSTVTGNRAALSGGGINANSAITQLTILRSTLSGNRTGGLGGGIYNQSQNSTITNSTISGNIAQILGGGIHNSDFSVSTLSLTNNTITVNRSGGGSGVFNDPAGTVNILNTIIAANTIEDAGTGPDVSGAFMSQGHNLIGSGDGSTGFVNGSNGDQVGTTVLPKDPMLGPLANNGGPTQTHALLAGSPAIDTADPMNFPPTDQRLVVRPQGAGPDIGAFETAGGRALPQLSIGDAVVTEGDLGTVDAVFVVALSEPTDQPVSVSFATANNSADGADYQSTSGTLTFAAGDLSFEPGETRKTITVRVNGDMVDEVNETFFVNLSGAMNATIADGQGVGTIVDDDESEEALKITINDVTVTEGDQGTVNAVFVVSISGPPRQPVVVTFETANSTADASDYQPSMGVITFQPGEIGRTITIRVLGDTLNEPTETFFVNLTNVSGATIEDEQGIGTILDDDARSILVTGADAGGGPHVKVFNASTRELLFEFMAYNPLFAGGVRVAVGDVNADGVPDVVTGAGPGGGPHVRVFDGRNGQQLPGLVGGFFAYSANFTGGVYVASGDVNNDGADDIITGADAGGGPHVRVFDGRTGQQLPGPVGSFFAYKDIDNAGVRVAAGDVNGDGRADVITGMGPGYANDSERNGFQLMGQPEVRVFSGFDGRMLRSFLPFEAGYRGGVHVAAGDFDGDLRAEIIVSKANGDARTDAAFNRLHIDPFRRPEVAVFRHQDGMPPARVAGFHAYAGFGGSVRVAILDELFKEFDDDTFDDDYFGPGLVTGAGPTGGPHVKVFSDDPPDLLDEFFAYDPNFTGGIFVAAGSPTPRS